MVASSADFRTEERRRGDEAIADEALPPPELAPDERPQRVEELMRPARPVALRGVVEGGVVRLLGGGAGLPERTRVIVVAAG